MGNCNEERERKVKPIILKPEEQAIVDCKLCRDKINNYLKRLSERQTMISSPSASPSLWRTWVFLC